MAFEYISFEAGDDGIALLTFNRPARLNALNRGTISELKTAFEQVATKASIRALILTGAGEKAFVAGADISELAEADGLQAVDKALTGQRVFRLLETSSKPSIAAING